MSESAAQNSTGPLAGVRVLDLATMLAGPYGATLLGDLGADVIKIESPHGDDSRRLGPQCDGEGLAFISLNRNKRDIVLDLRRPAAQEVFSRLAVGADILVTNIREPALSHLGLNYEQVRAHRRDIIWIGVTAFGADGPYAGRPGIDFLVQGYAGLLALTGEPGGRPVRVTVPLVDVLTSALVGAAAMGALYSRAKTGEGQRIDVSLLDALVHAQAGGLCSYLVAGEVPPKTGNRSRYFSPSGVYTTRDDRQVVITCPSDKFFGNLCHALGVGWAVEPRFENVEQRLKNEDELDVLIAQRCREYTRDELIERLVSEDVLTAPVHEIPEVTRDPQVRHNDMIVTTHHQKLGAVEVTGVPIRFRGTPGSVRRASPRQGQHTEEILGELGYGPEEISELLKDASVSRP